MMRVQPAGVGPAFNDGDDPAVEFAHLPWQPLAGASGQQGGAAAERVDAARPGQGSAGALRRQTP
jgi:hypothetical protein